MRILLVRTTPVWHGRRLRLARLLPAAALEPGHREVLIRRDVEGQPAAEVAAAMELSIEAVKSRLHRARRDVRDRLLARLRERR